MKNKINLITMADINDFVNICDSCEGKIELFCKTSGYRVNARSVLGCVAALEFENLWVESENDIYDKIEKYIVIGDNDGNYIHN